MGMTFKKSKVVFFSIFFSLTFIIVATLHDRVEGRGSRPPQYGEIRVTGIHSAEDGQSHLDHSEVTASITPGTKVTFNINNNHGDFTFSSMEITEVVEVPSSNGNETEEITSVIAIPPFSGRMGHPGGIYEGRFNVVITQDVNGQTREISRNIYVRLAPPFGGAPHPSKLGFQIGTDDFFPNFSLYRIKFEIEELSYSSPPSVAPTPDFPPL